MWEYMTTIVHLELLEAEDNYLRGLGVKGWEAYSAFPRFPHSENIVVMLKRKIEEE